MKKTLVFFFLFCFFTILFNSNSVLAATEDLNIFTKRTSSSITINWKNISNNYEVYSKVKNNEYVKVWEGNSNSYTFENLNPGDLIHFVLIALDDNHEVINAASVTTYTESDKVSDDDISMQVESIVYSSKIELNWDKLPNYNKDYKIYKDGEIISKTGEESSFTDTNISLNKNYSYEIVGIRKRSNSEVNDIRDEMISDNALITPQDEVQIKEEENSLVRNIKTLDQELSIITKKKTTLKMMSTTSNTIYRPGYAFFIDTWIPYKSVTIPWGYHRFHGDGDRAASDIFHENNYRTRFATAVVFDPQHSLYVLEKKAGKTTGVGIWGTKSGYANMSNVYAYGKDWDGVNKDYQYINYYVHHAAGNPLVPVAPAINYDFWINVWKDGSYNVIGTVDKSPSTSITISTFPGDTHALIYHNRSNPNEGVQFAVGLYTSKNVNISGS